MRPAVLNLQRRRKLKERGRRDENVSITSARLQKCTNFCLGIIWSGKTDTIGLWSIGGLLFRPTALVRPVTYSAFLHDARPVDFSGLLPGCLQAFVTTCRACPPPASTLEASSSRFGSHCEAATRRKGSWSDGCHRQCPYTTWGPVNQILHVPLGFGKWSSMPAP